MNYQDVAALQTNAATSAFCVSNPNNLTTIPSVTIVFTNANWLGGGADGFQFGGTKSIWQPSTVLPLISP